MAKMTMQNAIFSDEWATFTIDAGPGDVFAPFITTTSGTYQIDWGDGVTETINTGQGFHTYNSSATLLRLKSPNGLQDFVSINFTIGSGPFVDNNSIVKFINLEILSTSDVNFVPTFVISNLGSFVRTVSLRKSSLTGDISDFTNAVTSLSITDNANDINCNIQDLPNNLTVLSLGFLSRCILSGTLTNLPESLFQLTLTSNFGSVSGNLNDLPENLTIVNLGTKVNIIGNVSTMPSNCTYYQDAAGSISGNIIDLPINLTTFISNNLSTNLISGDLNDISVDMLTFRVSGDNTINGDIEDLNPGIIFDVKGNNTISGNLRLIDKSATVYIDVQGNNTMDYVGSSTFTSSSSITIKSNVDIDDAKIDQMLIDYNNSTFTKNLSILDLPNSSRTAASDTAYNALIADGMTINLA